MSFARYTFCPRASSVSEAPMTATGPCAAPSRGASRCAVCQDLGHMQCAASLPPQARPVRIFSEHCSSLCREATAVVSRSAEACFGRESGRESCGSHLSHAVHKRHPWWHTCSVMHMAERVREVRRSFHGCHDMVLSMFRLSFLCLATNCRDAPFVASTCGAVT